MSSFTLQKGSVFAVPITHYCMEMAAQVRLAFLQIQPDCVAVELPQTMQEKFLNAATRLPDISVVTTKDSQSSPLYFMCEPCDPAFEGLRSALEGAVDAYCIDLDVDAYPTFFEPMPDPYAIERIGLKEYYYAYKKLVLSQHPLVLEEDRKRESHMAKQLKELALRYEKILFVSGMSHTERVLEQIDQSTFPSHMHAMREEVELITLPEESVGEVMAECGWFSKYYEQYRILSDRELGPFPPDRQKLLYDLYKQAADVYKTTTESDFPAYNMRNLMKFVRNYALVKQRLMPDLYQLLSAAKGCVDHNYAYETWELATRYPFYKNIDNLPTRELSIQDIWGESRAIFFHLKEKGRKKTGMRRRNKDRSSFRFEPPGPFSICSYPPEDIVVERFGIFLQKKGTLLLSEEMAHTIPFSSSLEDGIDTKETIRHWYEKKLYVKIKGKPPGGVGSVVMIFDPDKPEESLQGWQESFPWCTTWLGEHEQESDMAFYATPLNQKVVGPGISRCEYGGFLMSYPPRRMYDVWADPYYQECHSKAELLLMAGIDYAVQPIVVYVAERPPSTRLKRFATRFGKKVVYLPIGQLSSVTLKRIRQFHVLDGHNKRDSADEYIM